MSIGAINSQVQVSRHQSSSNDAMPLESLPTEQQAALKEYLELAKQREAQNSEEEKSSWLSKVLLGGTIVAIITGAGALLLARHGQQVARQHLKKQLGGEENLKAAHKILSKLQDHLKLGGKPHEVTENDTYNLLVGRLDGDEDYLTSRLLDSQNRLVKVDNKFIELLAPDQSSDGKGGLAYLADKGKAAKTVSVRGGVEVNIDGKDGRVKHVGFAPASQNRARKVLKNFFKSLRLGWMHLMNNRLKFLPLTYAGGDDLSQLLIEGKISRHRHSNVSNSPSKRIETSRI